MKVGRPRRPRTNQPLLCTACSPAEGASCCGHARSASSRSRCAHGPKIAHPCAPSPSFSMIFMSLWQTSAGSTISTGADDAGLSNLRALAAELSTAAPTYAGTAGGVMGGPSTCSTSG